MDKLPQFQSVLACLGPLPVAVPYPPAGSPAEWEAPGLARGQFLVCG